MRGPAWPRRSAGRVDHTGAVRAGPMVLPDARGRSEGPGVMAIDLGAYSDDAKVRAQAEKLGVSWPGQLRVTLRYHLMGTWVGCGHRMDLPATARPGETRPDWTNSISIGSGEPVSQGNSPFAYCSFQARCAMD